MSFCKNCGYMFLSENDNMCGNCGTPRGQGTNYCSNCGASITADQNNCTMCGYFVGKAGSTANAFNQQNNANYANQTVTMETNNFQGSAFNQNAATNNSGYPVPNQNAYAGAPEQKSRLAAGLMGIFLGGLGVHNFYLGYTNRAILQLVLTIVGFITSCIGIGVLLCFGMAVWGFVEGIMILTNKIEVDGQGIPLKND